VCQNEESRKWAHEVCERTAGPTGEGAECRQCWKVGDLSKPEVLASAVAAARKADVVVVSMQAAEQLPLAFFVWLEGCLAHRMRTGGRLVAVMGVSEKSGVHADHTPRCLGTLARQSGLDFHLEERQVPEEGNRVLAGRRACGGPSRVGEEGWKLRGRGARGR
jgi:hypothetical protein